MNNTSDLNNTQFCHPIPILGGTQTLKYCNITHAWQPRITTTNLIITLIIPTIFTISFLLFGLYRLRKSLYKIYSDTKEGERSSFKKYYLFVSIVMLPIGKLIWDAIDVLLDLFVFYQLEQGLIVDHVIIRNSHVLNTILAFAIMGSIKILLNVYVLMKAGDGDEMVMSKAFNYLFVFLFEDCVELFVEYFWIEKYFTVMPPQYMIARDSVVACISLFALVSQLYNMRQWYKDGYRDKCFTLILFGSTTVIALVSFLRVGGAGYQYVTGKLNPACLGVVHGGLVQFPFAWGCLREVDYIILVLNFIPIPFALVMLCGAFA